MIIVDVVVKKEISLIGNQSNNNNNFNEDQ